MSQTKGNLKFYLIILVLLVLMVPLAKYSLRYMHWRTKANGYPGLYEQKESYPFIQAMEFLVRSDQWTIIVEDPIGDGDIPNWPDAKALSSLIQGDTIWFRFTCHNNIDLNDPMVSLAIENVDGNDWYGTVNNFKYGKMITAGYTRNKNAYQGYNFVDEIHGVCTMQFDTEGNAFYLGIPMNYFKQLGSIRFVASIGNKGLWNDDYGNQAFELPY